MIYSNEIYNIVKSAIIGLDYYGLIAGGAPTNEFDSEIDKICLRITERSSISEISYTIADVFGKSFSKPECPNNFSRVAEIIRNNIEAFIHR